MIGYIKRTDSYLLKPFEKTLIGILIRYVPSRIQTYHLTYMTLIWSMCVIIFSYLAAQAIGWMWIVSLIIFLQYITDVLDGEVGRKRNTGLVQWGYYMDHFLDFVFLSCLSYGYFLVLHSQHLVIVIYFLLAAFMIHFALIYNITCRLDISIYGIGPSELRVFGFVINGMLIFFGEKTIIPVLWVTAAVLCIALCGAVYGTQKRNWYLDMKHYHHSNEDK